MTAEDDFLFLQGADGLPEMLMPPDHEDRVLRLAEVLLTATDARTGTLAILEVSGGQDLARDYSAIVIRQALDIVWASLVNQDSTLEASMRGLWLLGWVNTTKRPRIADLIVDTLDEQFPKEL